MQLSVEQLLCHVGNVCMYKQLAKPDMSAWLT